MAEPRPSRSEPGRKVLVVDDDEALLRLTARLLRAGGWIVAECASATAALDLVGAGDFDVIVSDIDMPGLSGIEFLKRLRGGGFDVPFVLVTGAPSLSTAVEAVEHGAFKYLMKPLEGAELRATVEKAATSRAGGNLPSGVGPASKANPPSSEGETAPMAKIASGIVLSERYRLGRRLGEGGMSQVWEATQLRTGREVAVKLLHASLNTRPEMRERLVREARAASQVDHPNVVDVLDAFELFDGTPVLVMALLRGKTLDVHLTHVGRLSLAETADLLLPVVSAVGTAHSRGVIHRDLKPENIFLCDDNGRLAVKVVDFGIAKLFTSAESDRPLTATGALVGTPGYMSPEQALGEHDVDPRADIWSLGVILYEALAGVRPVRADNVGQMLKELFTETIVPIAERVPGLPADLTALIDRMLARERKDRLDDLRELYAVLSAHARVRPPSFAGPSILPPPPPPSGTLPRSVGPIAFARTEYGDEAGAPSAGGGDRGKDSK